MFKNGRVAMILAITLGVLGTASAALAGAKDDDGGGAPAALSSREAWLA